MTNHCYLTTSDENRLEMFWKVARCSNIKTIQRNDSVSVECHCVFAQVVLSNETGDFCRTVSLVETLQDDIVDNV